LYICNCNGIRERDVHQAIEKGATRPAHVFRHAGCRAECAKCICDMRAMIDQHTQALKYAAE